ncbi:MAG: CDP-alcohol phosphatidyltransferase family protein [Chitinispirillia bacterium]|nr:CDP-alcohol phosphatidyltransferase family protein [Chitinispirillia bacterium]MCL2269319.1 CDP-alcohol phosphatidyltransferase family protein [Chitinispirillia bacterium]
MTESELPRPEDNSPQKRRWILGYYGFWVVLTYLGAAAAVVGMNFALTGKIKAAVICLMIAGICDMFDGPVARLAKRTDREKKFGMQIDSLADIISFGILPAVIGYSIFANDATLDCSYFGPAAVNVIISVYVLAALIRLAYFNVTEAELQSKDKKRKYFDGMPVTSVALLIPIIYSVCVYFDLHLSDIYNQSLIVFSVAFVLKIKIPKLKLKHLIIFCLIGLPVIIYIFLSKAAKI